MNEKNAITALDKTADDIQEARDDNGCDDAEEEDDNEDEEHGEGRAASGVQRKRRQERSFYFTTEAVKSMHSKEGGILTKSVREDLELRWVTNLSEERKRFYLIATLLDPRTKLLSFCDNKYFPSYWKDEGHVFLSMEFKSFYMEHTQGEVNDAEAQVPKPSVLDDLLGVSSTSMDVDPYLSLEHTNIYSVD